MRVGYQKMEINGVWFKWNKEKGEINRENFRRRGGRKGKRRLVSWNISEIKNVKEVWDYLKQYEWILFQEAWVEECQSSKESSRYGVHVVDKKCDKRRDKRKSKRKTDHGDKKRIRDSFDRGMEIRIYHRAKKGKTADRNCL